MIGYRKAGFSRRLNRFSGLIWLLCLAALVSCEKVSPDVVEIGVDYSWRSQPGENRASPEIRLTGVPVGTEALKVELVDLDVPSANHGLPEEVPYDGNGVIPRGRLNNYIMPTPPRHEGYEGNRYQFTVKALDREGVVIGIGKAVRRCCP